jgi:acid stress-induced BolA-like protein IbaG/YrbA
MAITATDIEHLIRETFPDAHIVVQGDDGQHFAAEVVDASFAGMNRVQQQRAVNAAIREKLDSGELHALALTTRAPE